VPEGDTIHRIARRLQVLAGQQLAVEAPHPRAQAARVAERLDGRRLESVEAVGKNLVFRFEGGVVLRSHLRISGRWSIQPRGTTRKGRPWLVLRGDTVEGVLWNGPVLELHTRALERLGPDILGAPPRIEQMLARLEAADQTRWLGESLLDQSIVAGIGNMGLAEVLWHESLSPWRRLGRVAEHERRAALETAARLMADAVDAGREPGRHVYRRVGRPCGRCGTRIRSWGQGDDNRLTYWCPGCQTAECETAECQAGDDPSRA
jgi:endonuclease-8